MTKWKKKLSFKSPQGLFSELWGGGSFCTCFRQLCRWFNTKRRHRLESIFACLLVLSIYLVGFLALLAVTTCWLMAFEGRGQTYRRFAPIGIIISCSPCPGDSHKHHCRCLITWGQGENYHKQLQSVSRTSFNPLLKKGSLWIEFDLQY